MKTIQPCPFCGEKEKLVISSKRLSGTKNRVVTIKCQRCHAQGPRVYMSDNTIDDKELEAIRLWNRYSTIVKQIELNSDDDQFQIYEKETHKSYKLIYKKVINKIRKLILLGIKYIRKKPTEDQLKLFENSRVGDVLYAQMPLSMSELNKIAIGHRERPYVVVDKTKDSIIAYPAAGKKYKWLKYYEYYMFNKDAYDTGKNGYFQLNKAIELPIQNLKFKYKTLYLNSMKNMNKRLMISNLKGKDLPLFNIEKPNIEQGDIIYFNDKYYYAYSVYKKTVYCYNVYQESHEGLNGYYEIGGFYIAFNESIELSIDEGYEFAYMLGPVQIEYLKQAKEAFKNRNKLVNQQTIDIHYEIKYPKGQMFMLGKRDYLYLYHVDNRMYALELYDGVFNDQPIRIDEEWLLKGQILSEEQYVKIISDVVIGKQDHFDILRDILNKEYNIYDFVNVIDSE